MKTRKKIKSQSTLELRSIYILNMNTQEQIQTQEQTNQIN